ncbi:MAG: carboxypeptidase-like regulatory domain-containing protein [Chitinophagaceae bacterium]
MRPFILLLTFTLLGSGFVHAGSLSCTDPGLGGREEVLGLIKESGSKKPITRVNITAYLLSEKQKSVISDENGNYSFDDLKPGTYRLTFEKAGFKKVTKEKVLIRTDEGSHVDVEMEETRPIYLGPNALHFSDF